MEVQIIRHAFRTRYTIGKLFIGGTYQCNTLEPTARGLTQDLTLADIQKRKVPGATAIPCGRYQVDMDTVSPKYAQRENYRKDFNGGRMPRLLKVPGFEGILIHPGNFPQDTAGCILVGDNRIVASVSDSWTAMRGIYRLMKTAHDKGEAIWLNIS